MPTFKARHHREHIFWRFFLALIVAVVLLCISGASVKAAWEMYQTFDVASSERTAVETELAALQAEHVAMTATVQNFSSERGLEAAVRDRFGVVRPGEGEIRIVRTEADGVVEQSSDTSLIGRFFRALFVR